MKKIRMMVALAAALLGGAGAVEAQASAAPVDPVGMFDFEASMGIEARTGTLEIGRNAEGQLVGEAWLQGESEPAVINGGTISGRHVELNALVSNSLPVAFVLDFDGDEFAGIIVANSDTITVIGTRRN